MPTILELKKIEAGLGYDIVEENVRLRPELQVIDADTLGGTEMQLTVRTDLPSVAFTRPNEGVGTDKSKYDTRLFQTANLDAFIKIDTRVLNKFGSAAGGRYMSSEQSGHVEAAMRHAGKQFFYGVANDAKGFPGLIAQMKNDGDHVIDAGGGANKTSIYFIATGPGKTQWLFGNDRTLTFDDWFKQTVAAENGGDMEAMCAWMHWAPGVRVANKNSVVRIKNISAADHKATFDLLQDGLQKMRDDLGMIPTHILMSGRSRRQLRDLLVTPEVVNPPLPTEFEGIPILQSHSISNAETI